MVLRNAFTAENLPKTAMSLWHAEMFRLKGKNQGGPFDSWAGGEGYLAKRLGSKKSYVQIKKKK